MNYVPTALKNKHRVVFHCASVDKHTHTRGAVCRCVPLCPCLQQVFMMATGPLVWFSFVQDQILWFYISLTACPLTSAH